MIRDYCKMYRIKLSNVISECFSGTTSNRSKLNELKNLVENGNIESEGKVLGMKQNRDCSYGTVAVLQTTVVPK